MNWITLSNPEETFGDSKLEAIALSETHVKLLVDGKVIYESTEVSDCDMWESIEYKDKQFDLHIYFSEDIDQFSSVEEWKETCSIEICGLHQLEGSEYPEISYDNSLVARMSFEFDPMTLFKQECSECLNMFNKDEGRPYKYEPSRWVCEDCHDELMADDEAMESE
jgi:hypothetical protein